MTLERRVAEIFKLTDERWMRHANPISVWTRYSVLPFIVLAIWSRVWIGVWCAIPVLLSLAWMFLNPLLFNAPISTKNWASKAVLGERVYLNRDKIPLPEVHTIYLHVLLNFLSFVGLVLAIWGAIYYSILAAVSGVSLAVIAKSWYLDRMVWLYEDMKESDQGYKAWDY
ncbi:DUF6653 family protein [Zhongshania sp. BJYM1]|uniref:DUF6653 family protein n=1 Tax=Zhongshania aquatica TaxID=2965069 RepID=UPI0022B52710|nr:DUF6653 family protein [Marortus sp. BJYM1]